MSDVRKAVDVDAMGPLSAHARRAAKVGVAMIQQQADKWFYHDSKRRFTLKTNMDRMRSVLLNCTLSFTEAKVVLPFSPPGTPSQPGPQRGLDTESEIHGMVGVLSLSRLLTSSWFPPFFSLFEQPPN